MKLRHRLRDLTSKAGNTGGKTQLLERLVKDCKVKDSIGIQNECKTSASMVVRPSTKIKCRKKEDAVQLLSS